MLTAGATVPRCLAVLLVGFVTASACADERVVLELSPAERKRCLQVLTEGLNSEEFWPAMHAAEGLTLGGYGDRVVAALVPKLPEEKDDQHRCGLSRELVRAGKTDSAQVMLEILAGENPFGHVHAAESLYKVNQVGDRTALRRAFRQNENVRLKVMAAGALGRRGNMRAMEFLRSKLGDADADISRTSAWILGVIGDKSDWERIHPLIAAAPDDVTRSYYEHALAALKDPRGIAALEKNLADKDGSIRTQAATFAGDAGAIHLKVKLVAMLDDPHLDARIRAAQTLVWLANPKR